MAPHEPLIEDPAHLAELDGQRFVVLRAPVGLSAAFRRVQDRVRERLQGQPVSYPARAHVTLCGRCLRLPEADWRDVVAFVQTSKAPLVNDEVKAAEIVAFDNGREHSGGCVSLGIQSGTAE